MLAYNTTLTEIHEALDRINDEKYAGNVCFNRIDRQGACIRFTLRVLDSKGPGHRLGQLSQCYRCLTLACWHVHGDFFNALLRVNPLARIKTRRDIYIYYDMGDKAIRGNWQDFNIGSPVQPVMYSEACECERGAE